MKKTVAICLFLIFFNLFQQSSSSKYSIGIIYEKELHEQINTELMQYIEQLHLYDLFEFKPLKLSDTDEYSDANPVKLSLEICDGLIAKSRIFSIFYLYNSTTRSSYVDTTTIISYLCAYYQIPFISIPNREAVFTDKDFHNTFIRMTPSYVNQVRIWIDLIRKFEWKSVNLVHSIDEEGKTFAARFQYFADQRDIRIETDIEYVPDDDNYANIVLQLALSLSKVIILQATSKNAEKIMKYAQDGNLTTYGYVWIVGEEALTDLTEFKLRNGILTTKYSERVNPFKSSLVLLKNTFKNIDESRLKNASSLPTNSCKELGLSWSNGRLIYEEFIRSKDIPDIVEFDEDGEILTAKYEILNVKENVLVNVGYFESSSRGSTLIVNESSIVWPGGSKQKPDGTKRSMKLKIVTIEEKPFVFLVKKQLEKNCSEIYPNSIYCPRHFANETLHYCCYGYCIELLQELATNLSIEYELYLVPDGLYGDYDASKSWNGMMGEILNEKADMILAPFTISPERAVHVDFTKPYKYQGITILVKRNNKDSSFASFLQPFKDTLWIMVILSVHVVAVVLYLLDRFSPFGRFKLTKTDNTEEDALNLSRALWFTWGVLLNSGIGEGTPRSFSARVLGMVWAGFAMIMVASYTANLAAFLVLERPDASISGINDVRLRNPQDGFNYATVRGSSVEKYFKRQVELSTMYRTMEELNYNNTEEALIGLKNGKIKAFIWDSARLEYEASRSCEFVTAGELFGRSSYGLALKKGNPWLEDLSMRILVLHETGFMEDLDSKWISSNGTLCPEKDSSPSTLGLTNMAGVFMLVAGGIIMGIFLIFIEIAYKKYKDKKIKQHELSRNAFATWRKNVEKRKLKKTSMDATTFTDVTSTTNPQNRGAKQPALLNIVNNNQNTKQNSSMSLNVQPQQNKLKNFEKNSNFNSKTEIRNDINV